MTSSYESDARDRQLPPHLRFLEKPCTPGTDEIRRLASELSADAASIIGQPKMAQRMGRAATVLLEYAAEIRAREDARKDRDIGGKLASLLANAGPVSLPPE